MRIRFARFSAPAIALAISGAAQAQTADPAGPDLILVTASRTGDPAGVEIADRQAIERRQPQSLLEVLADLPGVRAAPLAGPAGPSLLSIRGGEGNFTAVLIDGIRLNDPTNSEGGAFDFTLLDPAIVERVEVVRSAGSAIHGSDALSGVVQVVTRVPPAEGFDLGGSAWLDSRGSAAATAMAAAGWGGGGLLGALGRYDGGDDDLAGSIRRTQALARARQAIGGFHIDAIGLHATTHGTAFPQDSGGPLLAAIRTREVRDGDLSLAGVSIARDPAARVRPAFSLGYTLQHHDSDSPPIAPGVLEGVPATRAHARFARLEATASLAADAGPATLALGSAILREDGSSDGTLDFGFPLPVRFALTRVTHSGFAEATLRLAARLTLSGAARYDHLSGGDGHWAGRGAIAWQAASDGPTLSARVANGYKRPSLYALGHPLIGNPALAPETGRSIEAGIDWPLGRGRLALTLFDNRFRNLIDFDAGSFRLVNRARVGTQGAELAAGAAMGNGWSARGALTYLAIDSATPLRWRPAWTGNVRVTWQHGPWEATAVLRGNSSFADSAIPTGPRTTNGHIEADLGGRYALSDRVAMRLSLLNLGGNRSWSAVGTPARGTTLRVMLVLD